MRIVVKHFSDDDEGGYGPDAVTVEIEPGVGKSMIGGAPVELTLGQQANIDIEGDRLIGSLNVQAVIE
jgi:hypothetical protein